MSDSPTPLLPTEHELGSAYRDLTALSHELGVARKEHLLSVFSGERTLVHLDLEGRLHRAWLDDCSVQRGLDGRLRKVHVERDAAAPSLGIELLPPHAAAAVSERIRALAAQALAALPAGCDPEVAEVLRRAASHDPQVEGERFRAAYEPIPILPPDQTRALVIQLTSGCSYNRCTFCHLYRDARFGMKSPAALSEHIRRVLSLLGRALPLRRGVFLGQANALVVARDKLLPLLDVVCTELAPALGSPPSLAAFVDAFSRPKSPAEWAELRARGVRSVALGLESGCDDVLRTLGKPAETAAAVALVERLHGAGIGVSVIVLAGAGGARWQAEHVRQSAETLRRMQLVRGDRVYLSPLQIEPGSRFFSEYAALGTLSRGEIERQASELGHALRAAGVTVPIARYDIRRFVY